VNHDPEGLPERAAQRAPGPHRAQHCLLFAVDVAGFTDVKRDDEVQLAVRAALYGLLIESFDDAHLPWDQCLHEDRGDGILVIIPAKMPSAAIVDPLLGHIRAGLRRHNRLASDAAVISLRVAVHIGEVHSDAHGLAGVAVNHLFRLLDAPVLKHTLAAAQTDVALIVSDYFYDSVLRHGPGMIDPAAYRPVTVEVKRTQARGWIHLPGVSPALADRAGLPAAAPDGPGPRDLYGTVPRPPAPQPPAGPAQGFLFFGPTTIHGDAVAGDKIVGGKDADESP
jgi:class 3 adenylate cyclase